MELINGKELARQIEDGIAGEINLHPASRPNLAIILVGNRPDSTLYVRLKEKTAKEVGIDTHIYRLEEATATQEELLEVIKFLNNDLAIDGILLQLPLPYNFDTDTAVSTIVFDKDVDGFTPETLSHLTDISNPGRLLSPVFLAVLACLETADPDWRTKSIAIAGKDTIFSNNLLNLLQAEGAKTELLTLPIDSLKSRSANILITALGVAGIITETEIAPGVIVIDIGISQNAEGKTVGDVAPGAAEAAAYLTPVPGGIGPLTIAFALKNTLDAYNRHQHI
ncbi:hypothetical protein COT94_02490 [Candidatus Falkowbacteria bacterium CG10_big_fil_rev_8_21_14_0_10_37_14]|uniref:Bifunctional protein FolD n=1 Tax=Candidatus Falkowbacteria bacterium CG10_big_fil_rev_8_21_14_0_10_37_14 TaxID=1974561 RepID=A0A2M6WTH9_9BACT|nr:bifunctional 5,10-methylenetetrahydrofolate dehydrogenase/5,10-methenyltetrahydrofolate cyclohydrolase [Candidatus Falkowbacteria bacterium]PIT96104.1 MAG: hypothetical protein COT94_02490 [Candidatus Falkowbacteria bacterium CG10_big_fil_rev_8_21_14_0_10_37_14]